MIVYYLLGTMGEIANITVVNIVFEVPHLLSLKPLKVLTQTYNLSVPRIMSNVMIMIVDSDNGNDNDSP